MKDVLGWVTEKTQPKRLFAEQAIFLPLFRASLFRHLSGLLDVLNMIRAVDRQVF
jgi:hypothetical protein